MLRRALASVLQILAHPRPLISIGVVFAVSNLLMGWMRTHTADAAFIPLILLAFTVVRTWSALGVQNVALGMARGEPDADAELRAWVSPGLLLQFALVGLVLFVSLVVAAIVAVTAFRLGALGYPIGAAVVVATIYAAIAVSQYPLLLLDERADMTDSVLLSLELTKGHRGTLLLAALIPLGFGMMVVGGLQLAGIPLTGNPPLVFMIGFAPIGAVFYAFWAALNASLFVELLADQDRRLGEPVSDAADSSPSASPTSS